jgi:hypothetical protein
VQILSGMLCRGRVLVKIVQVILTGLLSSDRLPKKKARLCGLYPFRLAGHYELLSTITGWMTEVTASAPLPSNTSS